MTSENIVSKKKDNLEKIKYFTNLLFSKNYSLENIKKFESDTDFQNFKFKIINMLAGHPKLLYYINKYFNSYNSHSISNCDWFDSLRTVILTYNIPDKSSLKFTKFRNPERKGFKSIVSDLYNSLNDNDLNELYRLYSIKIINNDHLNSLKITDKVIKIKNSIEELSKTEEVVAEKHTIDKHTFNTNIQQLLERKPNCKKCKYFKTEKLFIDGNTNNLNDIHVLFINDFSDMNDFERNKIFFEERHFAELDKIKYLIINILPCNIRNEFGVFKKTAEDCKNLTWGIIDNIKCNFKVLIGPRSRDFYKIKVKLNSKYINNFNGNYFLLPSPEESVEKFDEGLTKILSIVKVQHDCINSHVNSVSKDNPNLTLFDIKIIKNNILYIFYDENKNKQYFVEPIQFPVYIKNGNYRNCDYIESNMDEVAYITASEKFQLNGLCSKKLTQSVKIGG